MEDKLEINYVTKRIVPTFGGSRIEVEYQMNHVKYGRENSYKVVCEIAGLQSLDPHISVYSCEFIGTAEDTNDETLTEDGATYLFEEKVGII